MSGIQVQVGQLASEIKAGRVVRVSKERTNLRDTLFLEAGTLQTRDGIFRLDIFISPIPICDKSNPGDRHIQHFDLKRVIQRLNGRY